MVLTLTEPIDNAVPPILLIKPFNFEVSLNKRQQLDKVDTSPLTKKLLSFQVQLWSEHHLANSSSTNLPSLYNKL